jgi:hypothetical protein
MHRIESAAREDPDPEAILRGLVNLYTAEGPTMDAVMNDRSAMNHLLHHTRLAEAIAALERLLASGDSRTDLLRASCALGAMQRGLTSLAKIPAAPADGAHSSDKEMIVAAALAALRA